MIKYNIKKLSDYKLISNLGPVRSALFVENGFSDDKEIYDNFRDLYHKSWLSKFIKEEMIRIGNQDKFVDFVFKNKKKKFCIIGDYDADGIMATTIMKLAMAEVGIDAAYIIPSRLNDGYGVRELHIDKAIKLGAEVIITVDNGIAANAAVDYAKSKGLMIVITDHHIPDLNNLPKADLIINPHLTDEFKLICGAFVSFKLAVALMGDKENDYLLRELALFAAVATVSDVMPVINENRYLLKYVLDNINFLKERNVWAGRTLKFLSGFGASRQIKTEGQKISEDIFAYYIGPTLNAPGRVSGDMGDMVKSIIDSIEYGGYINGYIDINSERKRKSAEIAGEYKNDGLPVGFLFIDESKYEYPIDGLIGVVASGISNKYGKPSFVGTKKADGSISFSCRSIPGYSLYEGLNRYLQAHPETTVNGGGHAEAIGIHLKDEQEVAMLREHFAADFVANPAEHVETVFEFEKQFAGEIFDEHIMIGPFGKGFKKLKFTYKGKITQYDSLNKVIYINGYSFRMFQKFDFEVGGEVFITFSVSINSDTDPSQNYFKIDTIDELK
jgi:single-stranded-DNA-specific exonuclease